jgi:hypothetical protein
MLAVVVRCPTPAVLTKSVALALLHLLCCTYSVALTLLHLLC